MADTEKKDDKKDEKKGIELPLDRYEIVGIAVPGAALVAVAILWYLEVEGCTLPDSKSGLLSDITKATLGGLEYSPSSRSSPATSSSRSRMVPKTFGNGIAVLRS
jgi:hypothetical protein